VVAVRAKPPESEPPREVFALARGVAYVRAWVRAVRAARALRAELEACGLAERVPLRVEVAASGGARVELGPLAPETTELLAELLARARRVPGHLPGGIPGQREAERREDRDKHHDPHRAA
jgi:hypothetical protein